MTPKDQVDTLKAAFAVPIRSKIFAILMQPPQRELNSFHSSAPAESGRRSKNKVHNAPLPARQGCAQRATATQATPRDNQPTNQPSIRLARSIDRPSIMASSRGSPIAAPPLLLLLAVAALTLTSTAGKVAAAHHARSSSRVEVGFYMEALCPFCGSFAVGALKDAMADDDLRELIALRVVCFGNARRLPIPGKGSHYACQHGPIECLLNRYHQCAEHFAGDDAAAFFSYFECAEQLAVAAERDMHAIALLPKRVVDKCAPELAPDDPPDLAACAGGPLGARLQREAAAETAALDPPHTYVVSRHSHPTPRSNHPSSTPCGIRSDSDLCSALGDVERQ